MGSSFPSLMRDGSSVMGFLSKFFGGDPSPTSAKSEAEAAPQPASDEGKDTATRPSAEEPPSAVGPARSSRPPVESERKTPEASSKRAEPATERKPVAQAGGARSAPLARTVERSDRAKGLSPQAAPEPETPARGAAARADAETVKRPAVRPGKSPNQRAAARAGGAERRPALAEEPAPLTPPRRGVERPRKPLEESILTSAPKLPVEPRGARGAANPTPEASPPADTKPERASASTAEMDAAALAAFRSRRDHSKSPGFYSSITPAHNIHAVSAPSALKATMVGVGAKHGPERARSLAAPAASKAGAGSAAESPAADAGVSARGLSTARELPASGDPEAAPPLPVVGLDFKEDTSPGLGNNRSRHDPAAVMLPDKPLEVLLEFILALAMGFASETWLAPARTAVADLRRAAARGDRISLEKALGLLSKELDDFATLDERKERILHAFVAVNLALPHPVDIAARRAERERLIVEQLLAEVSLIHPLIPQRLRDDGVISSLARLLAADVEELSKRVSSSREQAEQVASTFQEYLASRAGRGPEVVILGKTRALRERLRSLEASAQHFDRVSEEEDAEARRRARRQRQAEVHQLNLLLAELGEASMLSDLERCSVQGKIERLGRWLSEHEAS